MHLKRGGDRQSRGSIITKPIKKITVSKHVGINADAVRIDAINTQTNPYAKESSPYFFPPYDSLSPFPLPENVPPFLCLSTVYNTAAFFTFNPCSCSISTPHTPKSDTSIRNLPPAADIVSSPPGPGFVSNPAETMLSPPPVFEAPMVYPTPMVPIPPPPNPKTSPSGLALRCVAKPAVTGPTIQEALNCACGSGADCESIKPYGSCFQPDTLFAHASYPFNSYWQRTKVAGGTCEFGSTAMLITMDPSETFTLLQSIISYCLLS
ncbi:Glucan endo-1,3-beta-D-glucosidase [Bertholletia excelsa]